MIKEQYLKQYFGYTAFREGQEALIDHILNARDVVGIMPTGSGKSICFQLPAMIFKGITLVISPLISLMKDQVQALCANGIPAAFINSTLTAAQTQKAIENARYGQYKIIYIAPERLAMREFVDFACASDIAMVTVDEAHCISQWGQDFRPNYLKINDFISSLPKRPIISAFTATATDEVKADIIKILKLNSPFIKATGFDRENLFFDVQKPDNKFRTLIDYLKNNPGKSGIIYCATRKTVEQVCLDLQANNFSATRYHAGLSESERAENQDDFLYDRKAIMVATNAFGMGIDKSNVNFVIHYNMPKNIESYYQEAGRAGRDGTRAECILLYGGQDVFTNQFLIDHTSDENNIDPALLEQIKQKERERLKQMTYYCHSADCFRAYILRYFGDQSEDFCDNCGNCKQNFETVDILEESKKILSCIYRMQERFGLQMLIDTLRGSRNKRILDLGLDKLTTYGIMKDHSAQELREIINHLVLQGYIDLTNGEYPLAKLGADYKELLFSDEPFLMKFVSKTAPTRESRGKPKQARLLGDINQNLFTRLKELRMRFANENDVPAFVIFSDATLIDMCRKMPQNDAEMLAVNGVGEVKLNRYGREFLQIIINHNENSETPDPISAVFSPEELIAFVQNNFEATDDSVPISILADMINALLLQKSNIKLSAQKLAKFFEEKGMLHTLITEGKNNRVATAEGEKLGIIVIERKSSDNGVYQQNLYNAAAQRWAAAHIGELLSLTDFSAFKS